MGFTQQRNTLSDGTAPATVSGMITDMHMSRPPSTEFFSGRPFPQCWVAINEGGAAPGINRYAMPCNGDSSFSIPNVPPGSYELKVFDKPLDVVIATQNSRSTPVVPVTAVSPARWVKCCIQLVQPPDHLPVQRRQPERVMG